MVASCRPGARHWNTTDSAQAMTPGSLQSVLLLGRKQKRKVRLQQQNDPSAGPIPAPEGHPAAGSLPVRKERTKTCSSITGPAQAVTSRGPPPPPPRVGKGVSGSKAPKKLCAPKISLKFRAPLINVFFSPDVGGWARSPFRSTPSPLCPPPPPRVKQSPGPTSGDLGKGQKVTPALMHTPQYSVMHSFARI